MTRTHIIGGGLAGLSAALSLAESGNAVTIYESGPVCGGRCRSYFDRELGCRIDNGNHLLLSGNHAAMDYLDRLGMRASLAGPTAPIFPFMDLATGQRWTVRMNRGRIPWWLLDPRRRVPGTSIGDYLPLRKLSQQRPTETVAGALPDGALYRMLLEPFAVAALNTPAYRASARLLGAVVDESLSLGGAACIPGFPREGLSESFVDPAISRLRALGAEIRTGCRMAALVIDGGRACALAGADGAIPLAAGDRVILAVPAPNAVALLPGLDAPDEHQAIINLHYRAEADPGEAGFFGLVGGLAEWVFVKPGILSVTISAANRLLDRSSDELAQTVWGELRRVFGLGSDMPTSRVLKEKRATFAATPAQVARRPQATTQIQNLALAGDWTATGLPATIEGAIRSGLLAVRALESGAGGPALEGS